MQFKAVKGRGGGLIVIVTVACLKSCHCGGGTIGNKRKVGCSNLGRNRLKCGRSPGNTCECHGSLEITIQTDVP